MDTQPLSQTETGPAFDGGIDAPPIVSFDERRMHIRAYNYWASLLKGRRLPSIEDLEPADIEDFGSHSVLLDFTSGVEDPSIAFVGSVLREQCGLDHWVDRISLVPARTLVSRLTDHYLQIIANEAPISFEAEFVNQRGVDLLYRGIMMPFSSDGETIDFIYGVVNWKEIASPALTRSIADEVDAFGRAEDRLAAIAGAPWPSAEPSPADGPLNLSLADALAADMADASLADRLAAARDAAQSVTANEGRTHAALYRALDLCHGFALAARARRDDYLELLNDAGLAESERSPTTTLVKLVFGAAYDKTRIAEYACVVDHAMTQAVEPGALARLLAQAPGGLKGMVRAIRAARKGESPAPASKPMTGLRSATRRLAKARPLGPEAVDTGEQGLGVVIVRREADGTLAMVASLSPEDKLAGRIIVATGRRR